MIYKGIKKGGAILFHSSALSLILYYKLYYITA